MKLLIVALVLAASPAFAVTLGGGSDELEVSYISWCQGSKVMGLFDNQEAYTKFDCADTNKTCKETQLFRMGRMIVLASCSEK